jgi:uncharacterized protein (TIGR02996 family)
VPAIAELEAHLREQPDDWQSWLVYADWLTDQGDAHGQLIQLEHRLTLPLQERERRELERRRRALLKEHRWQGQWPLHRRRGRLSWRRGYLHEVMVLGRASVEALQDVLALPHLQFLGTLTLGDLPRADLPRLAGLLARMPLHTLHLAYGHLEPATMGTLLQAAGALRTLSLHCDLSRPEALEVLARSEALAGLRSLSLGMSMSDEGFAALAGSPPPWALALLDLESNTLGPASAEILASAPAFSGLTSLSLSHNPLTDAGLERLARAGSLPRLASLRLNYAGVGDRGILALAPSQALPGLAELQLLWNEVSDEALDELRARRPSLRIEACGIEEDPDLGELFA